MKYKENTAKRQNGWKTLKTLGLIKSIGKLKLDRKETYQNQIKSEMLLYKIAMPVKISSLATIY